MIKYFLIPALVFTFSFSAFSAETKSKPIKRKVATAEIKCSASSNDQIDPEYVVKQIKSVRSCYEASDIAENCLTGASADNAIIDAAISICDSSKVSNSDAKLRKNMDQRCLKICNPETDGTMCISQRALCLLKASKFMNYVNEFTQ